MLWAQPWRTTSARFFGLAAIGEFLVAVADVSCARDLRTDVIVQVACEVQEQVADAVSVGVGLGPELSGRQALRQLVNFVLNRCCTISIRPLKSPSPQYLVRLTQTGQPRIPPSANPDPETGSLCSYAAPATPTTTSAKSSIYKGNGSRIANERRQAAVRGQDHAHCQRPIRSIM